MREATTPTPYSVHKHPVERSYTHEFFGFLGSRIYRRILGEEDNRKPFPRSEVRDALKDIKRTKRKNDIYFQKKTQEETADEELKSKFEKSKEFLNKERRDILVHQRPYEFAQAFDLDNERLAPLYHMDDYEIRHGFFKHKKRNGLEKTVALISGLLLVYGIINMKWTTANVIGLSLIKVDSVYFIILGILGLVYLFLYRKFKG